MGEDGGDASATVAGFRGVWGVGGLLGLGVLAGIWGAGEEILSGLVNLRDGLR